MAGGISDAHEDAPRCAGSARHRAFAERCGTRAETGTLVAADRRLPARTDSAAPLRLPACPPLLGPGLRAGRRFWRNRARLGNTITPFLPRPRDGARRGQSARPAGRYPPGS